VLRRLIQTVLAMAAVAAFASVAFAAIPSSNGLISACKTTDGAIKLIDKEAGQTCPGSQKLVEWNQQGPAGPAGPAGAAGPQGAQGPQGLRGPSDAYFTKSGINAVKLNPDAGNETLLSLGLPGGHYLVFADVHTSGLGDTRTSTYCNLYSGVYDADGGKWDVIDSEDVTTNIGSPLFEHSGKGTLIGPATFTRSEAGSPNYVRIACNTAVGEPLAWASINAIKVGTLTEK
jgi:hypothetical protein